MLELVEGKNTAIIAKGATKVTCKQAQKLLKQNKVVKIWWRPDYKIDYNNPDDDVAFVWYSEE